MTVYNKLLPEDYLKKSISDTEIVLPPDLSIKAIKALSNKSFKVLGWEGWLRNSKTSEISDDLNIQGTVSLNNLSIKEALEWQKNNPHPGLELFICLTVDID